MIHPSMAGTVRVTGRRASIPSAAAHRRVAQREQQTLLRRAQRRSSRVGVAQRDATVQAGNDERSGVTIFKFFPRNLRVDTGTTVRLRMSPRTTDLHTFSFGPSNGRDGYLDQIAEGIIAPASGGDGPPVAVFEPRIGYPSEDPRDAAVPGYDGTNHGNGFYNSGILDASPESPVPNSTAELHQGRDLRVHLPDPSVHARSGDGHRLIRGRGAPVVGVPTTGVHLADRPGPMWV